MWHSAERQRHLQSPLNSTNRTQKQSKSVKVTDVSVNAEGKEQGHLIPSEKTSQF